MADTARQTSEAFGDLEFEYNLKQLLDKDPIAALGFDPAKASYSVPQGDKYGTKYSREEDTLFYGPDTGSSKDILVHEFRHRGHQLLRNEIEKNPEAFAEKYGQDVVDFLTNEFSETEGKFYPGDRQEEFRTELSDNLEATYNKPRPSEEKLLQGIKDSLGDSANLFNDEELMALAVKNYVKNVDNTGYIKDTTELVTKEDQEKYKNILSKVRQAASDILQQRKGYDQGGTVGKVLDFLTNPLTGDYRKKKPTSVQMAEIGLEVATPLGTVNDIQAELEKDDPSYAKIAGMAGLELLGPAAGAVEMAARAGNKGLLQKILGSFKKKETDNNFEDLPAYDDDGNLDSVLTDEGVIDDIAELEAQKASGMFNTEIDVLSAWQAGVLDVPEYFDETYKVLNNKLKYLKPPEGGLAPEWSEYGLAKKFVDVYNAFGRDEIIQLAKDYPEDIDLIDKYQTKLGEYADELGVNPRDAIEVIRDAKSIVNRTSLTEVPLPKAFETGDIYPKKATEYSRDPLAMPPGMTATDKAASQLGFNDTVYHLAVNEGEFTEFKNIDDIIPEIGDGPTDKFQGTPHDLLGAHVGTARAAAERNKLKSGSVFNKDRPRFTMELRARLDKPVRPEVLADIVGLDPKELTLTADELNFTEGDLKKLIKQKAKNMNPGESYISTTMENKAAIALRKELAEAGYTHIPYENSLEDIESISYIMLVDRPKDSPAVLRDTRAKFDPEQANNPDLRLAEGGKVGNMSMKQQMSLFEYGGIADDGMTKDPVSGNNIPPGSLAKEVRDDIPAMLSEGEYVVPADVLRYYGVNFFENLRGKAKQGLQNMEQNGRIGGTPMTQQDVARNMQQPMMAPAPVQAAQGAMMQSPIRIQQQPAPQAMGNAMPQQQPIMANQGTMVQGFDQGTADPRANQYKSGWSPATARMNTPMFQGTSSQLANVAAAAETAEAAEITQFRNHYNQAGESAQVKYTGTTPDNMSVAPGQDDIISKYPLTEEEWLAYKKEMSRSDNNGGGDGGDTTPTGSDTSWMDGIDFGDKASVKEWVESDNGLGMSQFARGLAEKGGILGAIPQAVQAQDIAKVRGIRSYYESINDKEMVDYLDGKLKEAMKETGLITSAFDKLGLLTGDNYLEQIKSFAPTSLDLQKTFTPEQRREFTDTSGDMVKDEGGASVYKPGGIDVAMVDTSDDGPSLTAAEQHAVNMSRARSAATKAAVEEAFESGASTDDIAGLQAAVEEAGGTWATGGRAEGGLMTKGKPPKKKTRKYNKGGLAGKKK